MPDYDALAGKFVSDHSLRRLVTRAVGWHFADDVWMGEKDQIRFLPRADGTLIEGISATRTNEQITAVSIGAPPRRPHHVSGFHEEFSIASRHVRNDCSSVIGVFGMQGDTRSAQNDGGQTD
jgi:hypothetical protein